METFLTLTHSTLHHTTLPVQTRQFLFFLDAGTKTFFRLGQTIEHQIKKHGTIPPRDFKKWAVICEHIIRHYTEGWVKCQASNLTLLFTPVCLLKKYNKKWL